MAMRICCGFDLRLSPALLEENPAQWDQFLLVPDKRSLISADTMVWPEPDEVNSLIQNATMDFWNPLGLARSLDLLLNACRDGAIPLSNLTPVCLTVSEGSLSALVKRCGSRYFDNALSEADLLSSGWRFLGLDATQLSGLHSGLKGVGYKEPSWSQLRAQFGTALNEVGLFSDEATAAQFAEARGIEIPSHAPFDVVGVLVHDPISQSIGTCASVPVRPDRRLHPVDPSLI